jgi:hypothetical protein
MRYRRVVYEDTKRDETAGYRGPLEDHQSWEDPLEDNRSCVPVVHQPIGDLPALYRNWHVGLLDDSKKSVYGRSLLEFLVHGIKYVYPVKPGPLVRGTPTAQPAPPLSEKIDSGGDIYVWPDAEGTTRGETIQPLFPSIPRGARIDPLFYELLALVDAIRVGRSREHKIAVEELSKRILPQLTVRIARG